MRVEAYDASEKAEARQIARERHSCIGPIPAAANLARRAKYEFDLAGFLLEYLPDAFPDPFSEDHLALIATIQRVILEGGRYIDCQPRGFGKSTICEGAVLWCALYGHRQMVPLISTVKATAMKSMRSIVSELTNNDRLLEDFPAVCFPVRELAGVAQRVGSQTYIASDGEATKTKMEWKQDEIVLPTVEGSKASGVVICVYGIDSRKARGLRYKRADGVQVRPSFILIDDPQDNKIAGKFGRIAKLLDDLNRSILMSGGHKRKLACVIVATVIERNDFCDTLLKDRNWIGRRVKMLKAMPDNMALWLGEYKRLRQDYREGDAEDKSEAERKATAFYLHNRAEMDRGAVASWAHCKAENEVSALQHAMNLLIDLGERSFASECQNEPLDQYSATGQAPLEARDIITHGTELLRGECPLWGHTLTAFIDVGQRTHVHFVIAAYGGKFTGHVLDYGVVEVKQGPATGVEAAVMDALERAAQSIVSRAFPGENKTAERRVERILVDSGWQSRLVYNFCREKERQFPGLFRPSRGYSGERYRSPRPGSGARRGDRWHLSLSENRAANILSFDADHWKGFVDARWRVGVGGFGCLTLFKGDHLVFGQHCTAERPAKRLTKNGEEIDVWRLLPGRENHFLDCLSGTMVAASTCGVTLEGDSTATGTARASLGNFRVAGSKTLSALGFRGRK